MSGSVPDLVRPVLSIRRGVKYVLSLLVYDRVNNGSQAVTHDPLTHTKLTHDPLCMTHDPPN